MLDMWVYIFFFSIKQFHAYKSHPKSTWTKRTTYSRNQPSSKQGISKEKYYKAVILLTQKKKNKYTFPLFEGDSQSFPGIL